MGLIRGRNGHVSAKEFERPSSMMECFLTGTSLNLASVSVCGKDDPETRAEERLQGKIMGWEQQETWTGIINAHDIRRGE